MSSFYKVCITLNIVNGVEYSEIPVTIVLNLAALL